MNRRHLVKAVLGSAVVTSVTQLHLPTVLRDRETGREALQSAAKKMRQSFEALENRVDKMEHHHQNLLRFAAIGLAISTGVDLSLLL